MSVRLGRAEAWSTLADAHTGIFTSLRADGVPVSLPVWFVALDEHIYLSGPSGTKKVSRVAKDPRCSFLVESGKYWAELRAVSLTGRAHLLEDRDRQREVNVALDEKYSEFRVSRKAMPEATSEHYSVKPATIVIVPDDRILSWDNRRLDLG